MRTRRQRLKATLAAVAVAAVGATIAGSAPWASAAGGGSYEPVLNPGDFTTKNDNPYYPLPVGRVLVYKGVRDDEAVQQTVTVTNETKIVAEGITARVVKDVLTTSDGQLREKTSDWFAQDKNGYVWYLGEDTTRYNPDGSTDTSGSWEAGVKDAEPGLIMEADPQIPDAYRQEFLKGQAEDTAWIVSRGGSIAVPYGTLRHVLTSLEATRVEPGSYDSKVYAPRIGIALEQSLTSSEHLELVSVTG